jgi:branched-chain amino acid aminotransferase
VITLAGELGIPVRQEPVTRGQLYLCDELFMTGTAAEITPVRSVDKVSVGAGRPGEVTRRIMAEFKSVTCGRTPDRHGWLAPVAGKPKPVAEGVRSL